MKKLNQEAQKIFSRKLRAINQKELASLTDFNIRLVDSAPMSIMVIDKNGFIAFTNEYFKNFSKSEVSLYRNIFKVPFFVKEGLVPGYKRLLKDGTPLVREYCRTKNYLGETKFINIVAFPLKDSSGNIRGALSMALDATGAVLARAELRKLNSQLEKKVFQRTREIKEANRKLKKLFKMKSQFVSDASHELRTPLSIIKLNLEFFKKQLSSNSASLRVLNNIDDEIDKVSDILSNITFFTTMTEKPLADDEAVKINMNELLYVLSGRLKVLAKKRNIKIFLKKNSKEIFINGDRSKLERLFLNLISNSIKYGRKSGWIKIFIRQDLKKNNIKVIISDNGIGILKKDLPYIFDRFYRTSSMRNDGEGGFGLGLSISKWIVEQHHGSISVKSEAGKGSAFIVTLPLL